MSAKAKMEPVPFTGTSPDVDNLPKLRDLDEADGILREFLTETEGELTPEIAGLQEWLSTATNDKIERWGLWIRNREAEIEWLRGQAAPFLTEVARIATRQKALEAAVQRSSSRLLYEMEKRGIAEVDGKLITVRRQKNPPHVVGEGNLSTEDLMLLFSDGETAGFVRFQPEAYALDKAAVKAAVKGGLLPGLLTEKGVSVVQDEKVVIK